MKLGIVVSTYYWDDITSKMLAQAQEAAKNATVEVVKVPGCFDMPLAVKRLLQRVDAVVTLGVIIKGETSHDELIAHALATSLINLSLEFDKPVVLGVNGPNITREQAIARIPRAKEVVEGCLKLLTSTS